MKCNKQYFIYGISLPVATLQTWERQKGFNFNEVYIEFVNEDAFINSSVEDAGSYCLFNTRDGKFIILGRKIDVHESDESPYKFIELNDFEKDYIKNHVKKHFGIEGEYNYYFVIDKH